MREEDHLTVQLVITFLRNLLAVPDAPPSEAKGGRRGRMQVGAGARICVWLCVRNLLAVAHPFRDN